MANWSEKIKPTTLVERCNRPIAPGILFNQGDHLSMWPSEVVNPTGLDFDDVYLNQHVTTIESRSLFDPSITLDTKNGPVKYRGRIIAANMSSLCSDEFQMLIHENGGVPSFVSPSSEEEVAERIKTCGTFADKDIHAWYGLSGYGEPISYAERLADNGARFVILDIANGGLDNFLRLGTEMMEKTNGQLNIIAGNIFTEEAVNLYNHYGIFGAKLSIGTGSVCTTPKQTGIHGPTFSSIAAARRANESSNGHKTLLIADGGIKEPKHYVIALAAGADMIMMGGQLAKCVEAPLLDDGYGNKVYAGEASNISMKRRGKQKDGTRQPEGVVRVADQTMTLKDLFNEYSGGLKSAGTYLDAENVEEVKANAIFTQITENTHNRSMPHF